MSVPTSVLEAALLAEAPKQWESFKHRRQKVEKSKVKWQQEIDNLDKKVAGMKRQHDSELLRINELFEKKMNITVGLCCPECGEPDRGNKLNNKAWCMKCNVPLVVRGTPKYSRGNPTIKSLPKGLRSEVDRLNPGLRPRNDEP